MIESLKKILPGSVINVIEKRLNLDKLFDIRLRAGKPITINYGGKIFFLSESGVCQMAGNALLSSQSLVHEVVVRATDYSLYAVNDQLKTGYLSLAGGVRLGVAGEVVVENGEVKTIKNFSSVNIRVPHEVIGCSDAVYKKCFENSLHNTLIVSPPGAGKTTMLRDLSRKLCERTPQLNILLVDERSELAAQYKGINGLNVGVSCDVYANAGKNFAFSAGIRALAPDVIITDEIASADDISAIEYAAASGVYVIASCHGRIMADIKNKPNFSGLINGKIFTRLVELTAVGGVGTVAGVFNQEFEKI